MSDNSRATEDHLQSLFPGGRMTKNALPSDVNFVVCEDTVPIYLKL